MTRPAFGTNEGEHFQAKFGDVTIQSDGRKALVEHNSFVLFRDPVSAGVFSCAIAFGESTHEHGGTECQHIGVVPMGKAQAAVAKPFYYEAFAAVSGWGCTEKEGTVVTAGTRTDGAHQVKLNGKVIEMVVDAGSKTVVISTAGQPEVRFEGVLFPVVPAIYLTSNEATIISSNLDEDLPVLTIHVCSKEPLQIEFSNMGGDSISVDNMDPDANFFKCKQLAQDQLGYRALFMLPDGRKLGDADDDTPLKRLLEDADGPAWSAVDEQLI